MHKNPKNPYGKRLGTLKISLAETMGDNLRLLAFDNSFQANIISIVSNGKIIITNSAACKLLGYSKKELLPKTDRIFLI